MKELILRINGPVRSLLAQMYAGKEYTKEMFISDESRYHKTVADLKELVSNQYISISRKGKKAVLRILIKGQKEILN